jgi:beta-fructofuranosidase
LLLAATQPLSYRVGDLDPDPLAFRTQEQAARILDYGLAPNDGSGAVGLSGATVLTDARGRAILLGWIHGTSQGQRWSGVMALPRLLHLDGARLLQEPLPELLALRSRRAAFLKAGLLRDRAWLLDGPRGNAFEAVVEIKPGTATNFGVRLRGGEGAPEAWALRCADGRLTVAGHAVPYENSPGKVLSLRLFLDKSVLEAFLDSGRVVATAVLKNPSTDLRVEVFAESGDVQVQRFEVWQMRAGW